MGPNGMTKKPDDALITELKQRIKELEKNWGKAKNEPPIITVEPTHNSKDSTHKKVIRTTDMETLTKENNKLNKELGIFREIVRKRESVSGKDANEALLALNEAKTKKVTEERDRYKLEYEKFRAELIRFATVSKDMAEAEVKLKNNPDLNAYILQASALKQANQVLQQELQELLAKEGDMQTAHEKLWNELAKLKVAQVSCRFVFFILWG